MKTGLNYQLVLFCSFTIATIQSHFTQRKFVWGSAGGYLRELVRFYFGIFGFYVLNALLLPLLVESFNLDIFLSQCLLSCMLAILSFWFQKKFVFQEGTSVG
jgi:putative flippase GtrA